MTAERQADTEEPRTAPQAEPPSVIPIFPLSGVLLLPGCRLPLNIFEPRYLSMTRDALAGARVIGMVQPVVPERQVPDDHPDVFSVGCAGRIAGHEEHDDGRITMTLVGACRFEIVREVPLTNGYRRVEARYDRFRADLGGSHGAPVDRDRLIAALKDYFRRHKIEADWTAIRRTRDRRLVDALAMICPFTPAEKQALLEADPAERAILLSSLMEMDAVAGAAGPTH